MKRGLAALVRHGGTVLVAMALAACATVVRPVASPPSYALERPDETMLGRSVTDAFPDAPGMSGFRLIETGTDALRTRAALAERAQRTLDLQYYSVHDDSTTQLLIHRVLLAAHRGVRVRILVDDAQAAGRDFDLAALSAHENVDVRVFNPFRLRSAFTLWRLLEWVGDAPRLTRRMHNKLWIADNAVAIVGGRNLGDAYFDASEDVNFSDLDLLAAGPVVRELSRSFDDYWNSEQAVPMEALVERDTGEHELRRFEARLEASVRALPGASRALAMDDDVAGATSIGGPAPLAPAPAVALADPPGKAATAPGVAPPAGIFSARLRATIEHARREVLVISPYFIPGDESAAFVRTMTARGVKVRVLTNSLASTDVPVVHSGYIVMRPRLLDAGAEIYEMRADALRDAPRPPWRIGTSSAASLHAKAIVVDRRQVLIGSMNIDPRSRQLNTEVAVLLDSETIGARMGEIFDAAVQPEHAFRVSRAPSNEAGHGVVWDTVERGAPVRYVTEPASVWRRAGSWFLGLITPEDAL